MEIAYNQQRIGMNVFISYGAMADQVTALRLQALGAVNGLTVYVPPAYTREPAAPEHDPETAQKLRGADLVLGLVSAEFSEGCRQELNAGLEFRKPTLVMADPGIAPELQPDFGQNFIAIDPAHPDRTERELVRYLAAVDAAPAAKKALIALGTLALGLLIFAPQD
jgi:hypothetical protein